MNEKKLKIDCLERQAKNDYKRAKQRFIIDEKCDNFRDYLMLSQNI